MNSDSSRSDVGVSDKEIQEAYGRLEEFRQDPRELTGPEELEGLEREIQCRTDELG